MSISQINPNQLRPPGDDELGPIIKVGPQRRAEAVERLVSQGSHQDRDHARRFLDYARDHHINLEGLWSRLDSTGRIQDTVLAIPSPGRTAMVFASHVSTIDQELSMPGLLDRACRSLHEHNVNLAQVLLDPDDSPDRQAFVRAGFHDLAILSYLERTIRPSKLAVTWPANVTIRQYETHMRAEMLRVLEGSYEDTLDCPGLRGQRKTEDILEGHRSAELLDAMLWNLLYIDGRASGVALLNPSSDRNTIELVYLGLIKEARGRGLGAQLLRFALNLLANRRERTIHLAVDEANGPAIALYRREGFRAVQRRRALIRPLPTAM
jgi:ribosomal protein S18 acetylase RimI-like enzyme